MKAIAEKGFSLLVVLLLLLPVFAMNREKDVVSEIDNRKLVEAPQFGQKGFVNAFEQYLSDRIGGRSQMVTAYQNLNRYLFREMVHPTYTYGKDGYVFFKMHNNIKYGSFHEAFVHMVVEMNRYCQERGIPFYFMFNPEKIAVYRQYLPAGVEYNDEWVSRLIADLQAAGVTCVDNAEYLTEQSRQLQVFDRVYDAGHWNDLGCFMGMNHLFAQMRQDFPAVRELTEDDFEISTALQTSLKVSHFPISEEVPSYKLKEAYTDLTGTLKNEVSLNNAYPHFHYYRNDAENADTLPKVLIFQGSYLNGRPQFLVSNTSVDIGVHNYQNVLNLPYYLNLFNPDAVVFEVAEYTLSNTYFNYEKMKSLAFPPVIWNPSKSGWDNAAELREKYPESPLQTEVALVEGSAVDTLFVKRHFDDVRWAWLFLGGRFFDLTLDADGILSVNVLHDELPPERIALLFIQDSSGDIYNLRVPVTGGSLLNLQPVDNSGNLLNLPDVSLTSGSTANESDGFVFTTDLQDNRFNLVCFMVYHPEDKSYAQFCHQTTPGQATGYYTHTYPSGTYNVIIKGNTNLRDERATFRMYLEEGTTYFAAFTLDSLSDQRAEISNVVFR